MDSASFLIRPATPDDAHAIATVHVTCWEETYRGLLPDRLFDERPVSMREAQWTDTLARDPRTEDVFVATIVGQVVGFSSAGRPRGPEIAASSEL